MSKRGSGSSTRASGGFSKNEKAAISKFDDYAKQRYSVVGNVEYKKGEGERVEATFTTKDTFNRQRGGKMVQLSRHTPKSSLPHTMKHAEKKTQISLTMKWALVFLGAIKTIVRLQEHRGLPGVLQKGADK